MFRLKFLNVTYCARLATVLCDLDKESKRILLGKEWVLQFNCHQTLLFQYLGFHFQGFLFDSVCKPFEETFPPHCLLQEIILLLSQIDLVFSM